MTHLFCDLQFFILRLGLGCKRIEFFEKEIKNRMGKVVKSDEASHVLVEEGVASDSVKCAAALKNHGVRVRPGVCYVSTRWLSKCLSEGRLVDTKDYEVVLPTACTSRKTKPTRSEPEAAPQKVAKLIDPQMYICSQPSTSQSVVGSSKNEQVIKELQKLADVFRTRNDQWRCFGYEKAISAISRHPHAITSLKEASSIPGVGDKMAGKVMEIIENGRLRKAEELCSDEKSRVLDVFHKVWGVGPTTADQWYQLGCRTLQDLRTKVTLTRQQLLGLKHYDDIQKRIPRDEVRTVLDLVLQALSNTSPTLEAVPVGSYRRGKADCGDIDVMIVNDGLNTPANILLKLTNSLKQTGVLTDDLVSTDEAAKHRKYFGMCQVPGTQLPHRRIDLFVVPKEELAPALMHYTGSAKFNRSIRLLASRLGMCLTEHGLYEGTLRRGSEIINGGKLVPTLREEDIFRHLGLEYKAPTERDH